MPWHGKPLADKSNDVIKNIKKLMKDPKTVLQTNSVKAVKPPTIRLFKVPKFKFSKGEGVATRNAFGEAIQALGKVSKSIIGVDADVKNSTMLIKLKDAKPDQFID